MNEDLTIQQSAQATQNTKILKLTPQLKYLAFKSHQIESAATEYFANNNKS